MHRRQLFLTTALAGIGAMPLRATGAQGNARLQLDATAVRLSIESELATLDGATAWLNSMPLTTLDLRGKVVLVHLWAYSCTSSLRQIPYVRALAQRCKDDGLVVIGVHAPEFDFEQDLDNVRRATHDARIAYPVALDSHHSIWRGFGNQYWPALYIADAQGRIRHHTFGEGDYNQLEAVIQTLLVEAGAKPAGDGSVVVDAQGAQAAAAWADLRSPKTYVGHARQENFASPGGAVVDQRSNYALLEGLRLNQWALSGG